MSKRKVKAKLYGHHEVAVKPYVGTWEEFVQGAKQIYMRSPEKVRAAFFARAAMPRVRTKPVRDGVSPRRHPTLTRHLARTPLCAPPRGRW